MTAPVLLRPAPRALLHRSILHLDGRPFCSAGFTHDGGDIWEWIRETVADELGCHVDDVGSLETDDGDVVTVEGMPCFKIGR